MARTIIVQYGQWEFSMEFPSKTPREDVSAAILRLMEEQNLTSTKVEFEWRDEEGTIHTEVLCDQSDTIPYKEVADLVADRILSFMNPQKTEQP